MDKQIIQKEAETHKNETTKKEEKSKKTKQTETGNSSKIEFNWALEEIKSEKQTKFERPKEEKSRTWLSDKYNLAFLGILVFLVIFRFYWFFKLGNQPLWWDEADYMNMARTYLGAEYWKDTLLGSSVVRPILFPAIISIILFLGLGETSVRIIVLLCSIVSIPLIYAIGKQFFDKNTALFSSLILGVFWSFVFYSYRILVDIPIAMLWLATIFLFFYAYFNNKNWKYFVVAGLFLGISFLTKFSSIVLVGLFSIYLLTTERLKVFNKKIVLFYLTSLFAIIPYFLYQYFVYGHPLAFLIRVGETRAEASVTFLESLYIQTLHSIKLVYWPFIISFIIGLLVILSYIFLSYKKIIIKGYKSNKYYFILLWLVLNLVFLGILVNDIKSEGSYLDERYYFIFYPALFLLAGKGLSFIYNILRKAHKIIAVAVVIALLSFGAYQNINHANQLINIKKDSYMQLKQAGLFVKEHTNPKDKILILEEQAEISYYSERNFIHIGGGKNESYVREAIKENHPKYAVLSFLFSASSPGYYEVINFVFNNPEIFKQVESYPPYIDQEQKIPLATVFEINSNFY